MIGEGAPGLCECAGRKSSLWAETFVLGSQKSREGKGLWHSDMLFNPGQLVGVLVPLRELQTKHTGNILTQRGLSREKGCWH